MEGATWVCISRPDQSDYHYLTDTVKMPEDFINSVADVDERPRIESDGDWRLTILRIPVSLDEGQAPFNTVPLGIMTDGNRLYTLCFHKADMIDDFVIHTRKRCHTIASYPDFILRLLSSSTYWLQRFLKTIYNDVRMLEKGLSQSVRNEELLRLMHLQRSLVYFNTSLKGNSSLVNRIEHLYAGQYDPDLAEDAEIELTQADNTVSIYMDILSGTMDAFASIISNNVNSIMKRMTAISIVLMIPTLIASFYGMNVDISLAGSKPSFWFIVVASLILTSGIYFFLRRSKWF